MLDLAVMPVSLQFHYQNVQLAIEKRHSRSSKWHGFEKELIQETPFCCICGEVATKTQLVGHHILPYHKYPELELDRENIIIVGNTCTTGQHHLAICHYGDFRKWNPDVRELARLILDNRKQPLSSFHPLPLFTKIILGAQPGKE